jgi:hypothetical protein
MKRLMMLMAHFWSASIGPLGNERDAQNLLTMIADDFQGILISILNFFFFFPKQLATFWTFSNQHRHRNRSLSITRNLEWT